MRTFFINLTHLSSRLSEPQHLPDKTCSNLPKLTAHPMHLLKTGAPLAPGFSAQKMRTKPCLAHSSVHKPAFSDLPRQPSFGSRYECVNHIPHRCSFGVFGPVKPVCSPLTRSPAHTCPCSLACTLPFRLNSCLRMQYLVSFQLCL